MFTDMDYELEEDKLGIPTVPGTVVLKKDPNNLIGISIGGGAQYCPCLYIVQTITGCFPKIKQLIDENTSVIVGVALGIAALEICAMAVAMILYCRIKSRGD